MKQLQKKGGNLQLDPGTADSFQNTWRECPQALTLWKHRSAIEIPVLVPRERVA